MKALCVRLNFKNVKMFKIMFEKPDSLYCISRLLFSNIFMFGQRIASLTYNIPPGPRF